MMIVKKNMEALFRIAVILLCTTLVSCATGKTIRDVEDVRDDGKKNVVALTYEVEVYVTKMDSSVDNTKVTFRCPGRKKSLNNDCFYLKLPYRGTKVVDGFGQFAFEQSGAKTMKMKYGQYFLDSMSHKVIEERIPVVDCVYSKKQKREICTTKYQDVYGRHRAQLQDLVAINVTPGSGCYLGHLKMKLHNNELLGFDLDANATLTQEKLSTMSPDFAETVLDFVDRPCS